MCANTPVHYEHTVREEHFISGLYNRPPVAHTPQVEALLTHDALARPGAMLNVHLAGVPADALSATAAVAGELPHAVRHMDDCHGAFAAVASVGCGAGTSAADLTAGCAAAADAVTDLDPEVLKELAAAAGAQLVAEGFKFPDLGAAGGEFVLPHGRGFLSSTSQINFKPFLDAEATASVPLAGQPETDLPMQPPNIAHKKCSRQAAKWTSVVHKKCLP